MEVFCKPNAPAEKAEPAAPKHKYSVEEDLEFVFCDEKLPKYLMDRTSPDTLKNIEEIKSGCSSKWAITSRLHTHGITNLNTP